MTTWVTADQLAQAYEQTAPRLTCTFLRADGETRTPNPLFTRWGNYTLRSPTIRGLTCDYVVIGGYGWASYWVTRRVTERVTDCYGGHVAKTVEPQQDMKRPRIASTTGARMIEKGSPLMTLANVADPLMTNVAYDLRAELSAPTPHTYSIAGPVGDDDRISAKDTTTGAFVNVYRDDNTVRLVACSASGVIESEATLSGVRAQAVAALAFAMLRNLR